MVSAGGSSLNVVAGIAASGAPVDVGFVGVRGRREPPGSDLGGWFRRWGIDDSLVEEVEGPPGLCLSITQGMERTLLTTPGVNDRLGHWIRHHRGPLTEAIGRARIVHLTSLAGLDDLTPLIDLLDDALPLGGPDPRPDPGSPATRGPSGPLPTDRPKPTSCWLDRDNSWSTGGSSVNSSAVGRNRTPCSTGGPDSTWWW